MTTFTVWHDDDAETGPHRITIKESEKAMTDGITVKTNNVPRDVLDASELTAKERSEFDYLNWTALEKGEDSASFFRYKGQVYDIGDFQYEGGLMKGSPHPFNGWDGFISDTYFSGILIRFVGDFERVVVARFYS